MSCDKKWFFSGSFALFFLLGVRAPNLAAENDIPQSAEVTAAMQPFLDSFKLAGLIGIIGDKHGKIHFRNLMGYAEVETKKPMTEGNVFWIASMSKMFTGASIMMLVDEGKVSLEDPVTHFIPSLEKWMVVEEKDQSRLVGAYGPNQDKSGYSRGVIGFLTKPYEDRVHRFPEAGGGLFSTTHDIFRYGLMLANDGELDGKHYLSHASMDELKREQTGNTKVNYSLGYHFRNGMFGHDGAFGTDLSVNPTNGMVAVFMVQCTSGDQWAARDQFLKTASVVFQAR